MSGRTGKILDFSVRRELRTPLKACPCFCRADESRTDTRTSCRRLYMPPFDERDTISEATLRMSPYRQLDEAKCLSPFAKGDQHFERLAQLAGKIVINFFAVLSRR
jgi:hypothetical protein